MNNWITRRVALLVSVFSIGAAAAIADDAPLFDYREKTLDNGLHVITLEDHSCPIVSVQVWYHVGSKDENPERQGFAHMFEHMMFRGTDRLGPTDHFDLLRRSGGSCNAYTAFDNTTYHETLPANQLELALWLEAERMSFLKIDQSAFDTERKVVEEERRLGLNRPYGTALEKILPELFKVHPYRWSPIGQIPHLRAAAVPELREFWTRYYVPNNATLVVVGDIEHEKTQQLAQRYFGWIPRGPEPPRITVREPIPAEGRAISVKEDNAPAPVTGVVYRTVPVGHDDYTALQMLGMILGGGESSRLYRELVADKQLAVVAVAAAFSLEHDGMLGAGAVLSPLGGKTKKVSDAIDRQVAKVRKEPVSERELTKARNEMLKSVVAGNLTVDSKARLLGNAAVIEGDVARVNQQLARIRRVTQDDLLRVAQTYLAPERALRITIESNLLGTLFGKKKEDDSPVTAVAETDPPPPGRAGATRPEGYPEKPPVAGLLDSKVAAPFTSKTLPNGLKVMVVPNKESPFVSVSLNLSAGAWSEAKPGAAAMALGLLTKGTGKHSDAELADELETYGISLGGDADNDDASVSFSCVTDHLDRAMGLMSEVVLSPTFPPDEFEKQRKQVRTGLAISSAEPAYVADREMRKLLFGAHPYARTATGELEDVDALKVDDLSGWWKRFARPDMGVLIFSGDIDETKAVALATSAFGEWKAEGDRPRVELPKPAPIGETRIYLVDRPGVQCQIRAAQLSIDRTHPDYFTSIIVGGYFGGAFNSRLNETIRVKKGLTYGARGGFRAQRFGSSFDVSTFSKTESTAEAVQAVMDELARLKSEAPSDKELNDTKSYIVGSFPADRETPQQVASKLWFIESEGLPADYFDRLLQGVSKTTAEDCTRVVAQNVDPGHMVIVVVGPAAKLKDDLAKIAPVEIVTPKAAPPPTKDGDDQES